MNTKVLKKVLFNDVIAADVCRTTVENIKKVEVWYHTDKNNQTKPRVVLVAFHKGKGRFVSVREFYRVFKEHRLCRAQEMLKSTQIKKIDNGKLFHVPSATASQMYYVVRQNQDLYSCSCKDYAVQEYLGFRKPKCKHGYAVAIAVSSE